MKRQTGPSRSLAVLTVAALLLWASGPARAATVNWTDADGLWELAGNWDLRVPLSGDDVVINVAGVRTITHGAGAGNDAIRTLTNYEIVVINGGSSLTITTGGTNTGSIRTGGTTAGTLHLSGGTLTNTGGTLEADENGLITLMSNATVTGGTLSTVGSGIITTPSGGASQETATLNGVTIASGSKFVGADNSITTLVGI